MGIINRIGVIGAGTMGSGIAQACAVSGIPAVMIDVSDDATGRGTKTIALSLDRLVKKEKLTAEARDAALANVSGSTDYAALVTADLVVEAATENLELKLKVLRQIAGIVAQNILIASNTSSISITALAAVVSNPARFLGMHFFNPVPMMALVELIRGLETDETTLESAKSFVEKLGKTPVMVVNRLLCPMLNEAVFALQEGIASAEDIDNAMKLGCNHPIGPLALADMIGLDVLLAVMNVFYDDFNDPKYRPAPLLKEMVAAGRLGRKSGRGFYAY